jgi:GAF domain-containing protein
VIAPVAHVSVTIGEPANPRVIDSTSQEAQKLDGLQMQAEEGPCQSAWEERRMILTGDLRTETRWPVLTDLAASTDVVSVLALPVHSDGDMIGVINAYSDKPDAFGRLDVALAELAAYVVGQVFRHVNRTQSLNELVSNLRVALGSRSVIDQAKGILMERHGYTADEAFQALAKLSQQQNIKVRDLATLLADEVQSD